MTPITLQEIRVAAHNAAFIANCQCPMRYRNTKWEQVWRELRAEAFAENVVGFQSDDKPMRFKMSHGPDGDLRMSRQN